MVETRGSYILCRHILASYSCLSSVPRTSAKLLAPNSDSRTEMTKLLNIVL